LIDNYDITWFGIGGYSKPAVTNNTQLTSPAKEGDDVSPTTVAETEAKQQQ